MPEGSLNVLSPAPARPNPIIQSRKASLGGGAARSRPRCTMRKPEATDVRLTQLIYPIPRTRCGTRGCRVVAARIQCRRRADNCRYYCRCRLPGRLFAHPLQSQGFCESLDPWRSAINRRNSGLTRNNSPPTSIKPSTCSPVRSKLVGTSLKNALRLGSLMSLKLR